jgi:hypothetical protein
MSTGSEKIIGFGRLSDTNDDGTCRVRLYKEGLPCGEVLSIPYLPDVSLPSSAARHSLPHEVLTDNELDTMARQNVMYNSFMEVEIE